MSKIAYCPRGGQSGVFVSDTELAEYASKNSRRFTDEIIPLPGGNGPECASHDTLENMVYWESSTGNHGWACSTCGKVIQWG